VRIALTIFLAMLSYWLTPRVAVGDVPTSAQARQLLTAWNQRLRNFDHAWRCVNYGANHARQVRMPDEFGNFPAMGEFFHLYQFLDPENDIGEWPVIGPGLPEGANVASPFMAYVFGVDDAGILNEESRIGPPLFDLWEGINPPATNEEFWTLGKLQRGVINGETGEQSVPAIEAALRNLYIISGGFSPHGKSYGGFLPTPTVLDIDCGTTEATGLGIPSMEIKFTGVSSDTPVPAHHGTLSTDGEGRPVITYAGSCPWNTEDTTTGHVWDIIRYSNAFVVVVYGPNIDVFPADEWREGPYTGNGTLWRRDGQMISRALFHFTNHFFRGTDAQRTGQTWDIEKIAFDFEAFKERQYHLAPNRGHGSSTLIPDYPTAKITASSKATGGTKLKFGQTFSQESYTYHAGYVLSGMFAKAENLFSPVTLNVFAGTKVVARLTLTPDEPTAIKYLTTAIKAEPLTVVLADDARFDGTGSITFEANELREYTPNHWDAAFLLRLMATHGGSEGQGSFVDVRDTARQDAKALFDTYAQYGVIYNAAAAGVRSQDVAANPNPIVDSMRRMTRDYMRIVRRQEVLSYAKQNGVAELRFKRYAFGAENQKADIFYGIAPSYRGVSEVQEGIPYVVRSHTGGSVVYKGRRYVHNQRFTGRAEKEFTADGDALLLEYEGIRATAPKNGWTNEWLMMVETKVYHPSATSLWKTDSYTDWFLFNNRCHFYAEVMSQDLSRLADLAFVIDSRLLHLSPEAPSGYNYTLGQNTGASSDFCKSCPIYKKPYELASATVEFDASGNDVVKLVFKEAFQAHEDEPASFSNDPATWTSVDIQAEDYRTDSNALREYMLHQHSPNIHGSWKTGDASFDSEVQLLPDNPFGSIMPTFLFCALAKLPYEDGNNVLNEHDSRITVDEILKVEWQMSASCEGCVNGFSTGEALCDLNDYPYDFSWEDLVFQATGKFALGSGHGPLANTKLDAETFNDFGKCIDLLNMYRVDGLLEFQHRETTYSTSIDITPEWGGYSCTGGVAAGFWTGTPPDPAFVATGAWVASGGFTSSVSAAPSICGPGGASLGLGVSKTIHEFRYTASTAAFQDAIPDYLNGLITGGSFSVWGIATRSWGIPQKHTTTVFDDTGCITSNGAFWDSGAGIGYVFPDMNRPDVVECVALTNGTVKLGGAPSGTFAVCTQTNPSSGTVQEVVKSASHESYNFTRRGGDDSMVIVVPLVEANI